MIPCRTIAVLFATTDINTNDGIATSRRNNQTKWKDGFGAASSAKYSPPLPILLPNIPTG